MWVVVLRECTDTSYRFRCLVAHVCHHASAVPPLPESTKATHVRKIQGIDGTAPKRGANRKSTRQNRNEGKITLPTIIAKFRDKTAIRLRLQPCLGLDLRASTPSEACCRPYESPQGIPYFVEIQKHVDTSSWHSQFQVAFDGCTEVEISSE